MTQTITEKQYAYEKARGFMAERLKQVNDRPRMPEPLCLKLVQSLIDDGIPFDAKIGVVDSTPILALHLKEAGFNNLTFLHNKEAKYYGTSIRIWLDDVKGFCTNNKINTMTFNPDTPPKLKFDTVVGNPPYGSASGLAIKFLNLALKLSDDVRFVLPRTFRKDTVQARIDTDFSCVYDETLPDDTFKPVTSNTKTCIQYWAPGKRQLKTKQTTHADWTFLKSDELNKTDLMIRRCGTNAGAMFIATDLHKYKCGFGQNFFVKADSEVIERLQALQPKLIELGLQANNQACVSKSMIVQLYTETYTN